MPTLVLLRHAQAEPHRADDHGRVLSPRGRADAADVRKWLEVQGIAPQRAVVSTAARTRETWSLAAPEETDTVYDDRVYEASPEDLREVIAETAPDVGTLLVVGHNPSIERLAWELAATDETNRGLRTGGVAVLEVDDWALSGARLTAFR